MRVLRSLAVCLVAVLFLGTGASPAAAAECLPSDSGGYRFYNFSGVTWWCEAYESNGMYGTAAYSTVDWFGYSGVPTGSQCTNASTQVIALSGGYHYGARVNDSVLSNGGLTSSVASQPIYGANWWWTRYGVWDVNDPTIVSC